MTRIVVAILLFSFALVSCNAPIYEENVDITDYSWHKDSVKVFRSDSLTNLPSVIQIGVNLRNTVDYPYQNIWYILDIKMPNGQSIRDTLNHVLALPDGPWAEGVEGNSIKESRAFYNYGIARPVSGVYEVSIQHGMRDEVLEEIVSVGAIIEAVEVK